MPRYKVLHQEVSKPAPTLPRLCDSRKEMGAAYRECWTEGAFLLNQRAHLSLTVHRSARRELAALLESHDCVNERTNALVVMLSSRGRHSTAWLRAMGRIPVVLEKMGKTVEMGGLARKMDEVRWLMLMLIMWRGGRTRLR